MMSLFSNSAVSTILSLSTTVVVWLLLAVHFSHTQTVRARAKLALKGHDEPVKRTPSVQRSTQQRHPTLKAEDIAAIAGEDVLATQMDLARAYRESGQLKLAKKILKQVLQHGSHTQQEEARLELLHMQ